MVWLVEQPVYLTSLHSEGGNGCQSWQSSLLNIQKFNELWPRPDLCWRRRLVTLETTRGYCVSSHASYYMVHTIFSPEIQERLFFSQPSVGHNGEVVIKHFFLKKEASYYLGFWFTFKKKMELLLILNSSTSHCLWLWECLLKVRLVFVWKRSLNLKPPSWQHMACRACLGKPQTWLLPVCTWGASALLLLHTSSISFSCKSISVQPGEWAKKYVLLPGLA